MWWSFHGSDSTFEQFLIHAVAYVTKQSIAMVEKRPRHEVESQLLDQLDRGSYLIVLDGLERLLLEYSEQYEAPIAAGERQRRCTDPRVGIRLRRLLQVQRSHILISSRLMPAELESVTGSILPGCNCIQLEALADAEALQLWANFQAQGDSQELLSIFHTFGNLPLLIQALAGVVAKYRRAPGNFALWRQSHPQFLPTEVSAVQVRNHILSFALAGLAEQHQQVLRMIAAFRSPIPYDTLVALLIGANKALATEEALDEALTDLEERGLLGWNHSNNFYDLHPVVRSTVWERTDQLIQERILLTKVDHFAALPPINPQRLRSFDDLAPAYELFATLVELRRFDDALRIFIERLSTATLYYFSTRHRVTLLEALFPSGLSVLPALSRRDFQQFVLNGLGQGYTYGGQPRRGAQMYKRLIEQSKTDENLRGVYLNLTEALCPSDQLYEAELSARRAVRLSLHARDRVGVSSSLTLLGFALGPHDASPFGGPNGLEALNFALTILAHERHPGISERVTYAYLARHALWRNEHNAAAIYAETAWSLVTIHRYERDMTRAAQMQGAAALGQGHHAIAQAKLHSALSLSRAGDAVEDELAALVGLADLARCKRDFDEARRLLEDVWLRVELGPYPLIHADAFNVLAEIETNCGDIPAAIAAATRAYELAWCDGPPYSYQQGLAASERCLRSFEAAIPTLLPFDPVRFPPMPEVDVACIQTLLR